ncbi:hypothetical protein GXW82_07815 [Streptacidiphilus sp. 4-A2]|nr:hypothetical protein [Streptacidiphilus sp. 4-A2]
MTVRLRRHVALSTWQSALPGRRSRLRPLLVLPLLAALLTGCAGGPGSPAGPGGPIQPPARPSADASGGGSGAHGTLSASGDLCTTPEPLPQPPGRLRRLPDRS